MWDSHAVKIVGCMPLTKGSTSWVVVNSRVYCWQFCRNANGFDVPGGLLAHVRRVPIIVARQAHVVRGTCWFVCSPQSNTSQRHPAQWCAPFTLHLPAFPPMAHVAAVPLMGAVCGFQSGVLLMCRPEEWSVVGAAGRVEVRARFPTPKAACAMLPGSRQLCCVPPVLGMRHFLTAVMVAVLCVCGGPPVPCVLHGCFQPGPMLPPQVFCGCSIGAADQPMLQPCNLVLYSRRVCTLLAVYGRRLGASGCLHTAVLLYTRQHN
jgi:hypothetical protein